MLIWILLYGCRGGVSELLAILNFRVFRASCRYAVVILTIVLIFLAQRTSIWAKKHQSIKATILIFAVAGSCLYEQSARFRRPADMRQIAQTIEDDRSIVSALECALENSDSKQVFQLPVMEFPEAGPIAAFDGYGNLRPYLYSKTLKFSFGDDTGRKRNEWQYKVAGESSGDMLHDLKSKGFRAILINRSAYGDGASSWLKKLNVQGLKPIGSNDTKSQWRAYEIL